MPFLELLYLHQLVKCPCRYFFQICCICISLLNTLADTFFRFAVSASAYKIPLQMLFSVNIQKYASATCLFAILQILPCKNLHLQLSLSLSCRYSPAKICIHNLLFLYLQILPCKNLHPQLAFSLSCRYSPVPTHFSI